jgi:hypothetical protein
VLLEKKVTLLRRSGDGSKEEDQEKGYQEKSGQEKGSQEKEGGQEKEKGSQEKEGGQEKEKGSQEKEEGSQEEKESRQEKEEGHQEEGHQKEGHQEKGHQEKKIIYPANRNGEKRVAPSATFFFPLPGISILPDHRLTSCTPEAHRCPAEGA